MDFLNNIIQVIGTQILGSPAILVGVVALIGLLLQKKKFHEVIAGSFKTTIGFMIIGIGAGALVGVLQPMAGLFQEGLNITGTYPFNETAVALALPKYGSMAVLAMALSFVVNVIIARVTKFKFIYLTGHIMLFTATLLVLLFDLWTNLSNTAIIIVAGVIEGVMNTLLPALVQPYMLKVTGGAPIAYGHSSNTVAWLGGFLGSKFGTDPATTSTEDIKLPESLRFFRDTTVGTAATMTFFLGVIALIAGGDVMSKYAGTTNPIIWVFTQGLMFGAGVTVLLTGVRILIGEITIAFKGISDKLVPGALPALDCPVVMPFAPNAWIIGFVVSYISGLLLTVLFGLWQIFPYLVIASVIPHFFDSGPAAVFGNATGGLRGAIIAALAASLVFTIGISFLIPITGPELANSGTSWCCADYGSIYTFLGYALRLIGGGG